MRKYMRSKKGLTLVELVVTIAILGIVSGMSLTIVVTAMNNYSEAAIIEKEENTALLLEDYIVRNARVAKKVEFIRTGLDAGEIETSNTNKVTAIPSNTNLGFYIAKEGDVISSFYHSYKKDEHDHDTSTIETANRITYENVNKITFSIEKQKSKKTVNNKATDTYSYYLNYSIEMQSGYTLAGQTVMNNVTIPAGVVTETNTSFVDKQLDPSVLVEVKETSVIEVTPSYNTAIVFS